jgi:hypothetical protein
VFTNHYDTALRVIETIQAPVLMIQVGADPNTGFYNKLTIGSAIYNDAKPVLTFWGPEVHLKMPDLVHIMAQREVLHYGGELEKVFGHSVDL